MSAWSLTYDGFEPAEEGLREALCTLGNGYVATRGADPGSRANHVHYPGTYIAGCYNRLTSEVAGEQVENEALVNVPNWLPLVVAHGDGPWLEPSTVELLDYRQELDLRRGLLIRRVRFRHDGRTTRMVERRLVHMGQPHVCALEATFVAEDWSGPLRIRAGIDGNVENTGVERYRDLASRHLEVLDAEPVDPETLLVRTRTTTSLLVLATATRTRFHRREQLIAPPRDLVRDEGFIAHDVAIEVAEGDEVRVEKVASPYAVRDRASFEPGHAAVAEVQHADGFERLLESHALRWAHLWDRFRIELHVDEDLLRIVRLHLFHLLQTVSPNSLDQDVGVPPRGLHGEAYRGLIMWDELFVFPILDLRLPELTQELLAYRYRRLPEARRAAREAGFTGAMIPWQSSMNGEEAAQELHLNPLSGRWLPDPTHLQRHVGLAVAYNVWQHHQTTGDVGFLAEQGAEMMLEVARFFASLATYDPKRARYEIRGVVGPDEFHTSYPGADEPGLANNAYTNVMAAWLFARVGELPQLLPARRWTELTEVLALGDEEIERWEQLSRRLVVPFHDGVISQFEGYEQLAELDWAGLRREHGDIHRLDRILEARGDTPDRYKASKQADVLMLLYLLSAEELREVFARLGYELDGETVERTVDYYLARTSHGSTLSSVVHGWVLARSRRERAVEFFVDALESDVHDVQGGTTQEGIHLGAMAGSVDLLQRCFTGLETRAGALRVNPYWPKPFGPLEFEILYRKHPLTLCLTAETIQISSAPGERPPIRVCCRDDTRSLEPGGSVEFEY